MKYLFVTLIAFWVVVSQVFSAEKIEDDATISWRFQSIGEGDANPGGMAAMPVLRYYWNDQYVGVDRDGLAVIYDRLVEFKGKSVLFRTRPRKHENLDHIAGPKWIINPLTHQNAFSHFYRLLRKKNLRFVIEYRDDKSEPEIRHGGSNPFRDSHQ